MSEVTEESLIRFFASLSQLASGSPSVSGPFQPRLIYILLNIIIPLTTGVVFGWVQERLFRSKKK
jgi:NhaP-type Na+/H+ or K+/H+ antiporter